MYIRFSNFNTKRRYIQVLDETIEILKNKISETNDNYLKYISTQLKCVGKSIVDGKSILTKNEIDTYFNFGGYAVKNLPEDDELGNRLIDLYSGLYEFNQLEN